MANIDRIVNVQIALNTTGISREGFSTGIIVGAHSHTLNRVEIYTSIDAMESDGFTTADSLYQAANDYFAQTPKPKEVKIGRLKCDTKIFVADILPLGTYTILIQTKDSDSNTIETPYTFTNTGLTSATDILNNLADLISTDTSAVVTATVSGSEIKISSRTSDDYAVKISDNLTMSAVDSTENIASAMSRIVAEDNDFYGIMLTSRKQEDILAMANWTEAHNKLFVTAISESGAKDNTSITDTGYKLYDGNYFRTAWFYHENAESDFPDCAVVAKCFSFMPGQETWANKRLSAVVPNKINETEAQAIFNKNGNTFERFRNISITQNGKVASGEWIDIVRFRDWLVEEIQTRVFNSMTNVGKIPYTDAGIAVIEAQVRSALTLGQQRGGIAPTEYNDDGEKNLGFTTEVPIATNISPGQKASRILEDVKFTARLAGAIHVVEIVGSLTYENLIVGGE